MKKLNEQEITLSFEGKTVNEDNFGKIFRKNRAEYVAYCNDFSKEYLDLFGITGVLLESWSYRGVYFSVYVLVKDGKIILSDTYYNSTHLSKYKSTYTGGHGRPSGYYLKPTQQELRIFRRIMEYITLKPIKFEEIDETEKRFLIV